MNLTSSPTEDGPAGGGDDLQGGLVADVLPGERLHRQAVQLADGAVPTRTERGTLGGQTVHLPQQADGHTDGSSG